MNADPYPLPEQSFCKWRKTVEMVFPAKRLDRPLSACIIRKATPASPGRKRRKPCNYYESFAKESALPRGGKG